MDLYDKIGKKIREELETIINFYLKEDKNGQ